MGFLEGGISIAVNTILFVLKLWCGMQSRSVAMVADAWHTLSDTLTSLIVVLGFWIASLKADNRHPFGHGRAESLASMIIATLLAVVGIGFGKESVMRLVNRQEAAFRLLSLVIFGASSILKEALALFSFWAGKKANSASLAADGWHHRSDAAASILIVIGAIAGKRLWWIDGCMGLAISVLIVIVAINLLRKTGSYLIGESHDKTLESTLNAIVRRIISPESSVHHVHLHQYGSHSEVSFHVRFPPDLHLSASHEKMTAVEREINNTLGMQATIHPEPLGSNDASSRPTEPTPKAAYFTCDPKHPPQRERTE